MINTDIQFFGGRGSGGSGGARGGKRAAGGGGSASLSGEQTLSAADLKLRGGNFLSPALMGVKEQANKLKEVGDYIEIERTLKDGSVEVSRMTVEKMVKYNDVYDRSPRADNPDIPSASLKVPGWNPRTTASKLDVELISILLDKRSKTKSVTVRTYTKR